MGHDDAGQAGWDKIHAFLIASSMGLAEVCSILPFSATKAQPLELCATEGLKSDAVHENAHGKMAKAWSVASPSAKSIINTTNAPRPRFVRFMP